MDSFPVFVVDKLQPGLRALEQVSCAPGDYPAYTALASYTQAAF